MSQFLSHIFTLLTKHFILISVESTDNNTQSDEPPPFIALSPPSIMTGPLPDQSQATDRGMELVWCILCSLAGNWSRFTHSVICSSSSLKYVQEENRADEIKTKCHLTENVLRSVYYFGVPTKNTTMRNTQGRAILLKYQTSHFHFLS